MKNILFFLFILGSNSCNKTLIQETSPSGAEPIQHIIFSQVLKKFVTEDGYVNYAAISNDIQFSEYIKLLQQTHPDANWSENERLAYWINAYNAFTIQLIIKHYPIESIKDIPKRWSKKFIQIENKKYSLEDIEHEILRKLYKEPRIHFAINCASYSCPKLLNESFESETLDMQLDKAAKDFINDEKRNVIKKDLAQVSQIFKWFKSDFTSASSLKDYIQKYSETSIDQGTKIEYLEYKWELNDYSP